LHLSSVALATYLEPNHASKFFPCFDQNIRYSVFELAVRKPKRTTVLFNTESLEETEELVVFKPTPKMPLYLIRSERQNLSETNV